MFITIYPQKKVANKVRIHVNERAFADEFIRFADVQDSDVFKVLPNRKRIMSFIMVKHPNILTINIGVLNRLVNKVEEFV